MQSLIGQTLGQYRIVEQLGKGGMATVFKAFQPSLERYVAVKVLPPYFVHDPEFSERFVREAKAIARLDHPHILPIFDYGQQGELSYIVMKYVDAGTLKDLESALPLSLDQAVDIVVQTAEALEYAHRQGVIHRDVKPANILMDRGRWVLLGDFGLAKMVEGSQQLTASGVGVGTPAYMAPEQGQGMPADAQADIYSLGVVLYEMLTGRVPFEAETPFAVVIKHMTEPLVMPRQINPDIPESVELVLLKALAKDSASRYQSVGEMATALQRAVENARPLTKLGPIPQPEEPLADSQPALTAAEFAPAVTELRPHAAEREAVPTARRRRVPWWAYAGGAAVILAMVILGVMLATSGLWREGPPTLTPSAALGQQATTTLTPVPMVKATATAGRAEPNRPYRVGLVPNPIPGTEEQIPQLARYLESRMERPVEVVPVPESAALVELLRDPAGSGMPSDRRLDAALMDMPGYLWAREEGVLLSPLLYAHPVYYAEVFVRAEGDVQEVGDLRGKRVALVSWDDPAGILGRAELIDQGVNVHEECEVVYLAPMSELEAGFEALRLLDQGQVDAAITDNFAADMAEERFPEVRRRLRSLSQSALTSAGVVVAWPDGPAGSPDAFRTALEEIDPELIIPLTEYGGFLALDEPLYQTMAEALRKVGLTAGQLVANRPPEPWSPPNLPRRPQRPEALRVALVPGAGMSIEANRFTAPLLKALERASEDMGLELLVHETPPEEHPADGALGFIESGLDVLVTVGWADPDLLWGLADAFPEVTFVDFGHTYGDEQPNLLSFVYRIEEAGLLAGALAGQASQVGRVAVVSGPLTPVLEQLLVGFEIGIQLTCSDCELTTAAADSLVDAALGEQIGREVVQGGADVVFNAAGGTGSAAIRAAAQEGAWVIGMDWNEYLTTFRGGEVPNADRLLGSVVRRVDAQAYDAIAAIVRGDFRPGTVSVGVREGGIEYLPSPKAAHPEAPALQAMVRDLARDLEQGEFGP